MKKWCSALLAVATAAPAAGWRTADPAYAWSFPADHWAHPGYKTEWWYFTGHLESTADPGRRFGYQLTFFRVGLLPEPRPLDSGWAATDLILGHAAITDVARGEHRFSETLYRAVPLLGGFNRYPVPAIAWSRGPAGTDGGSSLHWTDGGFALAMEDDAQGFAIRLDVHPEKPIALQGPNGYSRKGEAAGAASQYYSLTRLRTEGTLRIDGKDIPVRGRSWMDREFGSNQLDEDQIGWDWFSLQLDDGRDVMLYLLRDAAGGTDTARGTIIPRDGPPRYLDAGSFSARPTGSWRSAASGAEYPSGWRVEVPGEDVRLTVVPLLLDQENRGALGGGISYWEGAVEVRGDGGSAVGRGYVELTGYGEGNRPRL